MKNSILQVLTFPKVQNIYRHLQFHYNAKFNSSNNFAIVQILDGLSLKVMLNKSPIISLYASRFLMINAQGL